ncbi:MAG TPA: hypothetical protein VKD69_24660 [Vicinamibacterales bacterium]|nr:hypothetical protein [Vicinamibacterales bacterium]
MTEQNARMVANAIIASAGLAAACVVLTTPPLRRFAMRVVRVWLGGSVAAYLVETTRRAWVESGSAA